MHIRNEQPGDAGTITRIQYAAFKGHPMHKPGAEPTEPVLVERLRADGDLSLSLLAEDGQGALGHIALTPARIGAAATGWYLLGPVGVVPERQGQGVGSALVREALDRMRATGALGVVLVGDPAFYSRFGFRSLPGLAYPGVPDQYVLGLAFTPAAPEGEISAHRAFHEECA